MDDHHTDDADMYKKMVRMAMMSSAQTAIIPIQDWAGLDNSARMNTPGTIDNNWSWRMKADLITEELTEEVLEMTKRFNRTNWEALDALKKKEAEAAKKAARAAVAAAAIDEDDDGDSEVVLSLEGLSEDVLVAFELEEHAEVEIELEMDEENIIAEVELSAKTEE